MADRFEDERGVIFDLLMGPIDSITEIFTKAGAVRGNHIHHHTTQWVYVVEGKMLAVLEPDVVQEYVLEAGDFHTEPPGIPHAWKALEDTTVLVFTRGPRSGDAYETDTERLTTPILS
jgi:quercetin dioxygenase-like cupin family protein